MDTLDDLLRNKSAVPGRSLAGWLLIGAECGKYREQRSRQWQDGAVAAQALRRGEVVAAAGQASTLESVLAGDARYATEPLPLPRMRDGCAVGMAVEKSSKDPAQAVQAALHVLASNAGVRTMFAANKVDWRMP